MFDRLPLGAGAAPPAAARMRTVANVRHQANRPGARFIEAGRDAVPAAVRRATTAVAAR